jgi:hypothetical protein
MYLGFIIGFYPPRKRPDWGDVASVRLVGPGSGVAFLLKGRL